LEISDGGCDELRQVTGGRLSRSKRWANSRARAINSSPDKPRKRPTVGSMMLPTIASLLFRSCGSPQRRKQ
jgi:hypothetical protein